MCHYLVTWELISEEAFSRLIDSMLWFSLFLSLGKENERACLYVVIERDAGAPSEGNHESPSYRSGSRTGRVRKQTRRTPPIGLELTRMGKSPVRQPRDSNGLNSMVTWFAKSMEWWCSLAVDSDDPECMHCIKPFVRKQSTANYQSWEKTNESKEKKNLPSPGKCLSFRFRSRQHHSG